MRAITLDSHGVDVRHDAPLPDDVPAAHLGLRVLAVGICGTDVSIATGARSAPRRPWAMGHEAVAQVAEVGSGVSGWTRGDVAVLEPNVTCLECAACRSGHTSACAHRRSSGVLTQPGFMAEHVVHPAAFAHHAPDRARIEDLVCVEPLAVAWAAVRRSSVARGDRVLVLGAGAQGLFATQVLLARGAHPVVTDPAADRVELAVGLGASRLGPHDGHFSAVVDTSGSATAVPSALDRMAVGAEIAVVGESDEPIALTSQDLVHHQLVLRGSFIYDHPGDFAAVLAGIGDGSLRPGDALRPASDWEQALVELRGGATRGPGKAWIDLRR